MNFYINVAPTLTEEMVEGNMSVTEPNDIAENIQDGMALTDNTVQLPTDITGNQSKDDAIQTQTGV
jgi:hypothetical protein